MHILSALLLAGAVAAAAPATAGEASFNAIALRFQQFPEYEQETPPPSKPTPMKHHSKAKKQDVANRSAAIDKLHEMILKKFGDEQDGFIQLSDAEFIVFVSNTGRVAMGLYRADVATGTLSDQPFAGPVAELHLLKDTSGNDYMLLHHVYPMHAGVSGESYSLLSARRSDSGKAIVSMTALGEAEEYDDTDDECARDATQVVHRSISVSLKDLNHDGHQDISVTQTLFNCVTRRASTRITSYLATQAGFSAR